MRTPIFPKYRNETITNTNMGGTVKVLQLRSQVRFYYLKHWYRKLVSLDVALPSHLSIELISTIIHNSTADFIDICYKTSVSGVPEKLDEIDKLQISEQDRLHLLNLQEQAPLDYFIK